MSFPTFMLFLALAVASLGFSIACVLYGAHLKKKQTRTVEFYPPEGYSPLDVLIKYKGKNADPRAVFNPLCLYWADKGLITIKEDCKRGLALFKQKEFPEYSGGSRYAYGVERKFFDSLFEDGDAFYTLAASKSFETKYEDLRGSIRSDAADTQTKRGSQLALLSQMVAAVVMVAFEIYLTVRMKSPLIGLALFPIIGIFMLRYAAMPGFMRVPFFSLWGGLPMCAMIGLSGSPDRILLNALIVLQLILVVFVFSRRIDVRSSKDLEVYARIDSFREFLLTAEAERVEMLVEDNPRYYYNILPYCYILNVTEKMKVKFDRVMMEGPVWYLGDIRNTLMF